MEKEFMDWIQAINDKLTSINTKLDKLESWPERLALMEKRLAAVEAATSRHSERLDSLEKTTKNRK